jgi:hypothetical protein
MKSNRLIRKTTGELMKHALTTITLLAISVQPALAQRPNAANMTCQQAKALVEREGAVVIGLGRDDLFERVVRHRGFCVHGQDTKPFFTRTRDNAACVIGDYCYDKSSDPTD